MVITRYAVIVIVLLQAMPRIIWVYKTYLLIKSCILHFTFTSADPQPISTTLHYPLHSNTNLRLLAITFSPIPNQNTPLQ
jgi:hypothetical protein